MKLPPRVTPGKRRQQTEECLDAGAAIYGDLRDDPSGKTSPRLLALLDRKTAPAGCRRATSCHWLRRQFAARRNRKQRT